MTMHRALGYVDRDNMRDGAPLRVIMATEGRKADGIDLRMAGAQLGRFRSNPVLGYGHFYLGRGNLPIGRVNPDSIAVVGTSLTGDLEFDQADDFARTVERKMRDRFLSAVSIGFDVQESERGGVATKWELTELSVVPVPMDADSLVAAGRGAPDDDQRLPEFFVRYFAAELARAAADPSRYLVLGDGPVVEPVDLPLPPAAGVPEDAARGLLAAFTKESHA